MRFFSGNIMCKERINPSLDVHKKDDVLTSHYIGQSFGGELFTTLTAQEPRALLLQTMM